MKKFQKELELSSDIDLPDVPNEVDAIKEFQKELESLINKYSIENEVDMPDFVLSEMLCSVIKAVGPSIKRNLDWHGCDSVCHPGPNNSKEI